MKKLILTLVVALVSACSFAQVKGDKAVGVNLSYGTEISNLGIGVKGQYNFTDNIRGEASFDYFLEKDGLKMWDINVNAHYLFPITDKIKVYPLVGLTYANFSVGSDGGDNSAWEYFKESIGWDNLSKADKAEAKKEFEKYYDDDDDVSASESKFGVNLGGGISYDITDKWAVNFEVKYQLISDFNQAVFGVGVAYKF